MKRLLLSFVFSLVLLSGLQAQTTVNSANFTWSSSNLSVQFTNTSDPLSGYHYLWTFGDGTASDLVHPLHNYQQAGTYTVCLKKYNPNNVAVDSICKQVSLTAASTCQVSYIDSLIGPLTRKFSPVLSVNTSAGIQFTWAFGDGTQSNDIAPSHQYANAGTYNVCLRVVYSNGCVAYSCRNITVAAPVTCSTDFRDSTVGPLTKKFFPLLTTAVPDSNAVFTWNFGDGTVSHDHSPVHQYAQPGTYNVCLRIQFSNGCVAERCHSITVAAVCQTDFRDTTTGPLTKKFFPLLSATTGVQVSWNFGDGNASNDISPTHVYAQPGTYNVCLRVYYSNGCVAEKCRTIIVEAVCQADFRDSTIGPLTKKFYPVLNVLSTAGMQIKWSFGDGTYSTEFSPLHQYAQPGNYTVCLRVQYANGCIAEKCKTITITNPTPVNCEVGINDSITGPHTYKFWPRTIQSLYVTSYLWNFGDGSTSTLRDPSHSFSTAGTYNVCLTVKYAQPGTTNTVCEARTCKIIVVAGAGCGAIINDSIVNQLKVQFWSILPRNDVQSLVWNFGDGTTSTDRNPLHQYQHGGRYRVCLDVKYVYDNCEAHVCKDVVLADEPCKDSFRVEPYFGPNNTGLTYQFFSFVNRNDAILYNWSFGDGTFSLQKDPIKTFLQPGYYNVCLRVTFANGCIAYFCKVVRIERVCRVEIQDSLLRPRTYKFSVRSSRPGIVQYQWNFGDGTTSTAASPEHTFSNNGNYHICVRTVFSDGCVAEDCDDLNVFRMATGTAIEVSTYPNPAENQVTFRLENTVASGNGTITIYTATGAFVKKETVSGSNTFTVDITELRGGTYIAEIRIGAQVARKNFVKLQ